MGSKAIAKAKSMEARARVAIAALSRASASRVGVGYSPESSSRAARAVVELGARAWLRPGGEEELEDIVRRLGAKSDRGEALIKAAGLGNERMTRALLEGARAGKSPPQALAMAVKSGSIGCVKLLMRGADEESCLEALKSAALRDQSEMVREMAKLMDAGAKESLALRYACAMGRWRCVEELLPFSNPAAVNCEALRCVALLGNRALLTRLALLCPETEALSVAALAREKGSKSSAIVIEQAWVAVEEREMLGREVGPASGAGQAARI